MLGEQPRKRVAAALVALDRPLSLREELADSLPRGFKRSPSVVLSSSQYNKYNRADKNGKICKVLAFSPTRVCVLTRSVTLHEHRLELCTDDATSILQHPTSTPKAAVRGRASAAIGPYGRMDGYTDVFLLSVLCRTYVRAFAGGTIGLHFFNRDATPLRVLQGRFHNHVQPHVVRTTTGENDASSLQVWIWDATARGR